MPPTDLLPHPNPARDYAEAADRIAALQARDGPEVTPGAGTHFLTHGRRANRAVLFFHGYTNSPKGWLALGQMFHELGCNVLIPREPVHGLRDRMTTTQAGLTAAGLARFASEAVDIAQGLGDQVVVAGLSMGGVLAAWSAQNRADVHLAAPMSPAFGFRALPARLAPLAAWLGRRLPNRFVWWDRTIKDTPHPPYHAYPRYATRSLAHILNLGRAVQAQARRSPPCAQQVLVITNPADETIDNPAIDRLLGAWRRAGAQNVQTYTFNPELKLIHDLVDPEQPEGQVGVVYPILLDLLM